MFNTEYIEQDLEALVNKAHALQAKLTNLGTSNKEAYEALFTFTRSYLISFNNKFEKHLEEVSAKCNEDYI